MQGKPPLGAQTTHWLSTKVKGLVEMRPKQVIRTRKVEYLGNVEKAASTQTRVIKQSSASAMFGLRFDLFVSKHICFYTE